jgi:hypothetical protein
MGIFFTYEFLNPRVLHVPNIPYAHNIGFPNYGHILFWNFQKSPINEYSVSLRMHHIVEVCKWRIISTIPSHILQESAR